MCDRLEDAFMVTTPRRPQSKRVFYRTHFEEFFIKAVDGKVSLVVRKVTTKHDNSFYSDTVLDLSAFSAMELATCLMRVATEIMAAEKEAEPTKTEDGGESRS